MKHIKLYISYILFIICSCTLYGQQSDAIETEGQIKNEAFFYIRGLVKEEESSEAIKDVNVEINGGAYTSSNGAGEFRVRAKIGDELIISHKDFETIYYTVKSDERITVNVLPKTSYSSSKLFKRTQNNSFNNLIDSALVYKKKSANKSIQFVTESIKKSESVKQNAEAFEVLADIYMHWKQYDLAVSNYRISLNSYNSNEVKLKLGEAYMLNSNYQESVSVLEELNQKELSNYQLVELNEGLGDVFYKMKDYTKSVASYNKGLSIAQKHLIAPKVTDLNSKIAQSFDASGSTDKAKKYYSNSLDLATQENKTRAIKEKVKVADFNNSNRNFDDEIRLRQEAILDIKDIEKDSIIDIESSYTIQKQNYKIGNALYMQKNYAEAIPYLEKSIVEAGEREDLVVEKDANRKLSEVFEESGDYESARKTYDEYIKSVEALFVKKEQQITQAARFNKSIAEKQNRITSLESDRELSESRYQLNQEQNKSQKIIIYSLIGGLLLLLFAAYLMYKYIKQQRLANNLLALKSLRSQMNPHFIFNALNSVNSFIATNDERTANKYLSDFSKLMRAVLENSEQDFIPLAKEVELLQLYTKLEHFRFQDKFDYNITVDEAINVEDYQIPPMLLQPYIENAVWHGLRYKEEKGQLDISITKKSKDEITITITDNGIGREKSKSLKTENQQKQNSKGMGNIKKRVAILNEMYKDKVDVFIDELYKGQTEGDIGTKVVVTLKRD
ncbi:histidine kinase [Lacinutrix sp. Bg11-31]|uniref:tetratricopeptide repeat-containing sensor histidine kinase n=1 Tax=Lacinutrix sp. Bg11-31 TaxID=2057808 RepID=UPI000C312C87|nr:histidine kinase [Lacinutrix sp. Bg11-31]AUC83320.1 sensor histidine kinase [Lacinutrix sp. Bg11-31]